MNVKTVKFLIELKKKNFEQTNKLIQFITLIRVLEDIDPLDIVKLSFGG